MTKGKTFFQGLSRGCSFQLYIRWFKTTFGYYSSMTLVIDLGKPNGEREKKKVVYESREKGGEARGR